ncbi:dual specificity protein phosphatase 22-A-like [Melopsittacus undulatus]|uniref:dual specificity protein phosphatase 22-A-like n=1 Tax=Melopsittacus undulatus TaxID=13146 RepID=UPI001469FB49|nr:dual specificity protein phosphatase 22-A-like [Melopsittacus undulatus]
MGSGMTKVVKGLYLGNIRDSEDHESLQRNGVTHILSIHNSAKPVLEDMTYLCISASDSSSQNLLQHFRECIRFIHECRLGGGACLVHCLAGVSRSTTVLVAYLMTVTELGWERCLAATRAVRSYVSPNFGFQQQLQEYEVTLLQEYRAWIRRDYGRNPFKDQEELQSLLAQQEQRQKEQQLGSRDHSWLHSPAPTYPLPYHAGGTSRSRWMNR